MQQFIILVSSGIRIEGASLSNLTEIPDIPGEPVSLSLLMKCSTLDFLTC